MAGLNFNGIISSIVNNQGYSTDPRAAVSTPEDLAKLAAEGSKVSQISKFKALTDQNPILGGRDTFSFANIYAQVLLPFQLPKGANLNLHRAISPNQAYLPNYSLGTTVDLPGLSMLSISEHRDVYPVVGLGRMGIRGYTVGNILYAGSLGFTVFDENPFLNAIRAYAAWRGDYLGSDHLLFTSPTELPPFDINLLFLSENNIALAQQTIRSVKIVDSAKNVSVNDIVITDSYSFMAASISNLVPLARIWRGLEDGYEPEISLKPLKKNGVPELKVAPIGNPLWMAGSRPEDEVPILGVNSLSTSVVGSPFNSSNWTISPTQFVSGSYSIQALNQTTTGLLTHSAPIGTPSGTGAVVSYTINNNGNWKQGDAYYLRVNGRLRTTATWTGSGSMAANYNLNTLLMQPNVVVKNPPPGATIYITVYDSWAREPAQIMSLQYPNIYKNYAVAPGSGTHYTAVAGDGFVANTLNEWIARAFTTQVGSGSIATSGSGFIVPQDYYYIEVGITANNDHNDSFSPTSIYIENKIELG